MAKLRSNHAGNASVKGGTVIRVGIFAAVISGLIYLFSLFNGSSEEKPIIDEETVTNADIEDDRDYYLPSSTTGIVIDHPHFSLSYVEDHEQAEWVAYTLTRERLALPWHDRPDRFEEDPKVPSRSATWYDYRGSGYDRGHLAPAADMAFSAEAIQESFFMSNISPQSHDFNKGIWKELEELTRSWAKKYKKLYVVTGPVLTEKIKGQIGDNEVSIPSYYYKVLLDVSEPEKKGIAFVLPNQISYDPLYEYAVTIDEVEEMTGGGD
jgi:endonuclease G